MKKEKLQFLIILFSLLFIKAGCKKDSDNKCISLLEAPVAEVSGPGTGSVNQDIPFTVAFDISNGCGQFSEFEVTSSGNTKNIKVIARYEGCICTQIFARFERIYNFKATQAGTYLLQFKQADGNLISKSIIIQ